MWGRMGGYGWDGDWGWGDMFGMSLFWIMVVVAIVAIVAIVALVRCMWSGGAAAECPPRKAAFDILNERHARGEIEREEFARKNAISRPDGGYNPAMRALLAFLLCLAVASQGIANAYAFKHPCPMEQDGQVMMMDAMNGNGDCCNDADTVAKTGKLCKSGQPGNLTFSWAVISFQAPLRIPASSCLVTTTRFMPLSSDPSAVWRPPTIS